MALLFENDKTKKNIKKTRQGCGRGTKLGNKNSNKHYIKRYRGQGGRKKSKA